ncbi:hypothetical protein GQR58_029636 [Nymphon striatum]|nr:hypothetical protein GQR58_029636 [Nymphon striatum]
MAATACGGGTIDIAEQLDQQQDAEPTVAAVEPTAAAVEPTAVPPTPEPVEEGSIEDVAAATALSTIEALKTGDVESLGINGQAILNEDFSGVWVSAVESGSPADGAGIIAGDVILKMEGLDLGRDGTLSDYCDIIRTNGPDDTMSIEVLRLSTEELLEGQINGEPLAQSFSFAMELADDVGTAADTGPVGTAGYDAYEFVSDESASVGVEVPTEWIDRDGEFNEGKHLCGSRHYGLHRNVGCARHHRGAQHHTVAS